MRPKKRLNGRRRQSHGVLSKAQQTFDLFDLLFKNKDLHMVARPTILRTRSARLLPERAIYGTKHA